MPVEMTPEETEQMFSRKIENFSFAFFHYPDIVRDMVTHWAELCARQIEQLPEDIPIAARRVVCELLHVLEKKRALIGK
jgi:hypothetical protein